MAFFCVYVSCHSAGTGTVHASQMRSVVHLRCGASWGNACVLLRFPLLLPPVAQLHIGSLAVLIAGVARRPPTPHNGAHKAALHDVPQDLLRCLHKPTCAGDEAAQAGPIWWRRPAAQEQMIALSPAHRHLGPVHPLSCAAWTCQDMQPASDLQSLWGLLCNTVGGSSQEM